MQYCHILLMEKSKFFAKPLFSEFFCISNVKHLKEKYRLQSNWPEHLITSVCEAIQQGLSANIATDQMYTS